MHIFLRALLLAAFFTCTANADDYALILSFKCGDEVVSGEVAAANIKFRDFCLKTGTRAENILEFSADKVSRNCVSATPEAVMTACGELAGMLTEKDTLRVIFTGYVSKKLLISAVDGRLDAKKLSDALNSIKASREYYVLTSNSHAMAGLLHKSEVLTLSGADSEYQASAPRITPFLMDSLAGNTELLKDNTKTLSGKYKIILKNAADEMHRELKKRGIAVSENPVIYVDGGKSAYPFDEASSARMSVAAASSEMANEKTSTAHVVSAAARVAGSEKNKVLYEQYRAEAEKSFPDSSLSAVRKDTVFTIYADKNFSRCVRNVYFVRKSEAVAEIINEGIPADAEISILYPDGTLLKLEKNVDKATLAYVKDNTAVTVSFTEHVKNTQTDEFDSRIYLAAAYPVCSGRVKVEIPSDIPFHTLLLNAGGWFKKTESAKAGTVEYTLDFGPVEQISLLPGDPNPELILPNALLTTRKDWNSLAMWVRRMMKRSAELTEDDKKYVHELVDKAVAEYEEMCRKPENATTSILMENVPTCKIGKLKLLYNMVSSIRYITVPVGGAAFRPQSVSEIRERGYADCKDKANMLVRLAAEFGIKGYCALVNRFSDVNTEIPAWQFNHMVAIFPDSGLFGESLWLDPTDGKTPFGSLPQGDIGTTAMLIYEDGAVPLDFKKISNRLAFNNDLLLDCDFTAGKSQAVFTFNNNAYTFYAPLFARSNGRQELFRAAESLVHDFLPGAEVADVSISGNLAKLSITLTKESPSRIAAVNLLPLQIREAFKYSDRPNGLSINGGMSYSMFCTIRHDLNKDYFPALKGSKMDGCAEITKRECKIGDGSSTYQEASLLFSKTAMNREEYRTIRDYFKNTNTLRNP